uniref:F-box domain-containing protein n=1 Tax=Percolomonas cosmopolitus TaxID=63605 RepID=A0A7S1KP87_9EUKA|mmetsp:Transcript_311/g.1104  ORF Transcript_311/g.1104 Transcript_311/m.1104 type:complete len:615 (+) Transcript_311:248-2092(+)|eukprot:CAMPEP_0117437924 /NCGR_PEP_ID=MMETSP0759-20121206/1783_1 /TAXON_ID=63605 /ORGANISM="Percolomonas cosmopolitus, Strain WS" /LENGTH=614 /DNA_ID=CAMNT_0005229589 /DNA_START=229 /DNA_END=2073 /DNA_ORIENTATION=+
MPIRVNDGKSANVTLHIASDEDDPQWVMMMENEDDDDSETIMTATKRNWIEHISDEENDEQTIVFVSTSETHSYDAPDQIAHHESPVEEYHGMNRSFLPYDNEKRLNDVVLETMQHLVMRQQEDGIIHCRHLDINEEENVEGDTLLPCDAAKLQSAGTSVSHIVLLPRSNSHDQTSSTKNHHHCPHYKPEFTFPNDIWIYNILPYIPSLKNLHELRLISKSFNKCVMNHNHVWRQRLEYARASISISNAADDSTSFIGSFFWGLSDTTQHTRATQSRVFSMPSEIEQSLDSEVILTNYIRHCKKRHDEEKRLQKLRHKKEFKSARKRLHISHLKFFVNPIGTKRLHMMTMVGFFWSSCILYFAFDTWFVATLLSLVPFSFLVAFCLFLLLKFGRRFLSVVATAIIMWTPRLLISASFPVLTTTHYFLKHPLWIVFVPLYLAWILDSIPLVGFWVDKLSESLKVSSWLSMILHLIDAFCWVLYYVGVWGLLGIGWMPKDLDISFWWVFFPIGLCQVVHVVQTCTLLFPCGDKNFSNKLVYPVLWLVVTWSLNLLFVAFEIFHLTGVEWVASACLFVAQFEAALFLIFLPQILRNAFYKPQIRNRVLTNFFRGAIR